MGAAGTALIGLALVLVAAAFDAEALYVPGVAFAVLGTGAGAWVRAAATGVRIVRELDRHTVEEEEPLRVSIAVTTRGAPLPGGWIDEPLLALPAPLRRGGRSARVRIDARFSRRGLRVLAPPRLVVRDPLGLAQRAVAADEPATVLVLPRVSSVRAPAGWGAVLAGRSASLVTAPEVELDGLRAYQPGSPASRIHWPALARGHGMQERRLRAELDARPLVLLDARAPATEQALDQAVRAAASLCVHLAARGGCALLLPGERRATAIDPDLGAWHAAHARLALVKAGGAPAPSAAMGRSGPVFYVAARAPSTATLPRALRDAGGGRVLVVPARLPGMPVAFEVAGCRGYALRRRSRGTGVAA